MGVGADGTMRATEEAPRTHHIRYDYRYDSHGNWTERVVSSRADAQSEFTRSNVEWRRITYDEA
jgi:hypothetical protein